MSSDRQNNRKREVSTSSNNDENTKIPKLGPQTSKKLMHPNQSSSRPLDTHPVSPNRIDNEEDPSIDESLQSFHKQRNNRYCENSSAPFIVFVFDSNFENNLGNIHITSIGMKIYDAGFKVSALKREGTKRFSLSFSTFEEANNFVEEGVRKINLTWRAYIPDVCIFSAGLIIDLPTEISIEKLRIGLECLDSEPIKKLKGSKNRLELMKAS